MTSDQPDRDHLDLSAVLHALSDPQRRGIVAELAAGEVPRPCSSFAPQISKSTRTHHFRVLREAGLIEQWKEGTSKMSKLRRDDVDARFPGLLDSVLSPHDRRISASSVARVQSTPRSLRT